MVRPAQRGQALEIGTHRSTRLVRSMSGCRDGFRWRSQKKNGPGSLKKKVPKQRSSYVPSKLAVVVALKVFCGEVPRTSRSRIRIVPTTTDNRGNGADLNQLMTTKVPGKRGTRGARSIFEEMGLRVFVEWSPKEANREADALANRDHSQFSPELRIPVSPQHLQWSVLTQAWFMGERLERLKAMDPW